MGVGETVAFDTAEFVHPKAVLAFKVYCPVASVLAFVTDGFCAFDANEFGPLHVNVLAPDEVKVKFPPEHTLGLFTLRVGSGFITTVVCAKAVHPAALVTTTVYAPAFMGSILVNV